jgi:hypothetical protein
MTACAPEATASDNRTARHSPHTATFTIAADGAYAARLTTSADGGWFPERWTLDGPEPYAVPLPGPRPEQPGTHVLPLADGRVLAARPVGGAHTFALLYPTGPGTGELPLGALESERLTLLPPAPCGRRAYALTPGEYSTGVWLVAGGGEAEPRLVAQVPGRCAGGAAWLDREGRLLALDRTDTGGTGRTKTVALDLARGGEMSPLLQITTDSEDRLLLADPDSGLLLVHSDAAGEVRLGWGVLGSHRPVRFPEALHPEDVVLTPFALQPGQMLTPESCAVALHGQPTSGMTAAWLGVWRPAQKDVRRFRAPAGWLPGKGVWTRDAELRLPCTTVHAPCGLARLRLRATAPPEAGSGAGAAFATPAADAPAAAGTNGGPGAGEQMGAGRESGVPQAAAAITATATTTADAADTAAPRGADRPEAGDAQGHEPEAEAEVATAQTWPETPETPREEANSQTRGGTVHEGAEARPWPRPVRRHLQQPDRRPGRQSGPRTGPQTGQQLAAARPLTAPGPGPLPAGPPAEGDPTAGTTATASRQGAAPANTPANTPAATKPPLPVRKRQVRQVRQVRQAPQAPRGPHGPQAPQGPQTPPASQAPEGPHLRGAGVRLAPPPPTSTSTSTSTMAPSSTSASASAQAPTPAASGSAPVGPATLGGLVGGLRGGTVIRTLSSPSRPKPAAEGPRPPAQAAPGAAFPSPGPESFGAPPATEPLPSAEPFSQQPTAPPGAGAETPCPRPGPVPLQDAPLVSALHDAAVRARSA